jgi:hypothetical protein
MGGPLLPALPEGFGRAAEKLADTVRHVVDLFAGPDHIRAQAQAQADSAVILAAGRADVQEIETRAVERLRKRETRRQRNIEAITLKAVKALPSPDQISDSPVSEDWTSRFFEECQDIGDEQMQQLWARLLAGEVARPGSFSPRTLSVVRDLTKGDADLFTKLCGFAWWIPGWSGFQPVIKNVNAPPVRAAGLYFPELTHLTTIGLVELNTSSEYGLRDPIAEIAPTYRDTAHRLKSQGGEGRRFDFGHLVFTVAGAELFRISGAQGSDEIRNATLEAWSQEGWMEDGEAASPPSEPAA